MGRCHHHGKDSQVSHPPPQERRHKRWHGLYYGWKMLLAISLTEMVSWGVLYYAFTVFLKPMQASLGWSTAQLTGAFSLALLCSAVAALPVGRWLDQHGTRWIMT